MSCRIVVLLPHVGCQAVEELVVPLTDVNRKEMHADADGDDPQKMKVQNEQDADERVERDDFLRHAEDEDLLGQPTEQRQLIPGNLLLRHESSPPSEEENRRCPVQDGLCANCNTRTANDAHASLRHLVFNVKSP